jgi:hypothetical protein
MLMGSPGYTYTDRDDFNKWWLRSPLFSNIRRTVALLSSTPDFLLSLREAGIWLIQTQSKPPEHQQERGAELSPLCPFSPIISTSGSWWGNTKNKPKKLNTPCLGYTLHS